MVSWMVSLLAGIAAAGGPPDGLLLQDGRPLHQTVHLDLDPSGTTTRGWTEIAVALDRPRKELWLNAHGLTVTEASIVEGASGAVEVLPGGPQHVGFRFPKQRDQVVLRIAFEGASTDLETQGLFRQVDSGEHYLFTQFEAYSARDVFPCFDQPGHKIPWTVELTVPEADRAFSNAPAAGEQVEDGLRTVRFEPTRPLPSYLLAFAVGPFDVVEGEPAPAHGGGEPIPVRILTPKGKAEDAAFAAQITGEILGWEEAWFDRPYLYEKLDVVALPITVGFGAMEHPGLVTITADAALATEASDNTERQRSYAETMAHEIAHQWFGNQVTPRWWEDLWLNESFATWMEGKVMEGLYEDGSAAIDRVAGREGAMALDSLASVRRIREPIEELEDIESAFDGITYGKGGQVLAMTEAWVGPEVFLGGVRAYLDTHADGAATTEDFVSAISKAHGSDIGGVYADFLDQPGVPLIRTERICEPTRTVRLTVERYVVGGKPGKARWQVPVCIRELGAGADRVCTVLDNGVGELPLEGPCDGPVLLNDGMTGYYRSALTGEELDALLDSGGLTVGETVGLIGDASALVALGELEPGAVLDALPDLLALDEPRVTQATLDVAAELDDHLVPDDLRPNYERFLRDTYGPLMDEVGLEPGKGEGEEVRRLRSDLIRVVGGLGSDRALIEAATEMAWAWLETGQGLHPDVRDPVLRLAARYGDVALYEAIRTRAEQAADRSERAPLLGALGAFRTEEAARRNLEWAMSKELDIRESAPLFFGALSDRKLRPFAWDFTRDHIDALEKMLPSVARGYLIFSGSGFCEADRRAEVESFFAPRAKKYLGGRRMLANVLEGIDLCVATTNTQRDEVRAFLEQF